MLSRDQFANKGDSLIDRYNNDNPIREQLLKYGYKQGSSPDDFISPNSKSGHQVRVYKDAVACSMSGSDEGVGWYNPDKGSWNATSFGLMLHYEFNNNIKEATQKLKEIYPLKSYESHFPNGLRSTQNTAIKSEQKLFTKLSDIDRTPPIPIVEDMLFAKSLISYTGASFSGKTFAALDAFLSLSAGIKYHGRATKQGNVGLVIGEGQDGIFQRCEAWCSAHDLNIEDIPLYVSKQPINMREPELVQAIIDEFKPIGNFQAIVIDTLARNFGGGNENAPSDMGQFINACDTIIHNLDCAVAVVHHTGKDHSSGARGHSSFFGALTTEIMVEARGEHDILLTNTKQKDAKQFEPMQFVKVETLGSITLELVEYIKREKKDKLGKNDKIAWDTFVEAYTAKQATNTADTPCRLHVEEWREFFNKRHTGDTNKAKNDAFRRARERLVSLGLLEVDGFYYDYGDKAT